jgi:hypothetical protein
MSLSNPYEDPRLATDRVGFNQIGDRVQGTVSEVKVQEGQFGSYLLYALVNATLSQYGNVTTKDKVELPAGTKNLKAALMAAKPVKGDRIDVELIELRPTGQPQPAKIFRVDVQAGSKQEDLFAS